MQKMGGCLNCENGKKTAFIIVDAQNDFMEYGSLPVTDGTKIIPVINDIRKKHKFELVALTSDWHPENHCSF